jgi:hypothetical protein
MKIYIITYRDCDMEGMAVGFPKIFKAFTNKEDAEKTMNAEKEKSGWMACGWTIVETEIEK